MNISYSWLQEYVPVDLAPDVLADQLTMLGLEVDGTETLGSDFTGVVVGHVLSVAQHPDADRLQVCIVNIGSEEPVQIVCGAKNVAAGQNVPVATIGTQLVLPEDEAGNRPSIKIKKSKLRGVLSQGMICAEDELGLSDDHAGIMVLSELATVGQPFSDYLDSMGRRFSDVVFDIALTPNRPDAICHVGVARDIAALNKLPLESPRISSIDVDNDAAAVDVFIDDTISCKRYSAVAVRGVTVADSPDWLKNRLTAIGLRPRNNVVDITNYVMHELGQPLHGFDLDKISGSSIGVRSTSKREKFTTLDGKERELEAGTPMIADGERFVAIAGVMGGENSEVSDGTTNVLIESAYFDPPTIRKVAKKLGLQTDASYRFERGVDPKGQLVAAIRAGDLIVQLAGGTIDKSAADVIVSVPDETRIRVRPERVNSISGAQISTDRMIDILLRLGFEAKIDKETILCTVPSYRHDVVREIDVVEEILRVFGFDNIPEPSHTQLRHFVPRTRPEDHLRQAAENILTGNGYSEIYTNSLISPSRAEDANAAEILGSNFAGAPVVTANAISSEMSALRPSLLPGAINVISHNLNHGREETRLFEFGHVFRKGEKAENIISGYIEVESLCITLAGSRSSSWNAPADTNDIFSLKGIVTSIFEFTGLKGIRETPHYSESTVSEYRIEFTRNNELLATVGRVGGNLEKGNDITLPVYFAELNWSLLVDEFKKIKQTPYSSINRFPVVSRDLAILVAKNLEASDILATVTKAAGRLLQSTKIFDVYTGKGIDANQKSLAINVRLATNKTLTEKEVDKTMSRIVDTLSSEHDAILRQ